MLRTCLQSCRLGEFLGSVAALVYLRRHIQMLQKQGVETWTARGHKSERGSAAAGSPWIVLSGSDRVWHSITLACESAREIFASLVWNRAIDWRFYYCSMMLLSSQIEALVDQKVDVYQKDRLRFRIFYFGLEQRKRSNYYTWCYCFLELWTKYFVRNLIRLRMWQKFSNEV